MGSVLVVRAVLGIIVIILASCTWPTPCEYAYQTPERVRDTYQENEDILADEVWPEGAWWKIFGDPQLECLIDQALCCNPSIDIVEVNIRLAEANAVRERSFLSPWVDGFFNLNSEQDSRTGRFPVDAGFPFNWTDVDVQLNLTWDLDIWGKRRDSLRAAFGDIYAERFNYRFAELMLSVAVAKSYYNWQLYQKQRKIVEQIVDGLKKQLLLTEERVEYALDNQIQIDQVELEINTALDILTEVELQIDLYRSQLETLLASSEMTYIDEKPLPDIESLLPFPITLNVVGRRPDIQAKVWEIYSSLKLVDVARKDFYPDLSLVGLFGFSTIDLYRLFSTKSTQWKLNPALNLPLFHAGELEANLFISQDEYRLSVLEYNQMVLDAAQETIDAMNNLKAKNKMWHTALKRLAISENELKLNSKMVEHNLRGDLDFVQSEISLLTQNLIKNEVEGLAIINMLSLIKAVGG